MSVAVARREAVLTAGGEPETPRSIRWRVAIYPIALAFGALAMIVGQTQNIALTVLTFGIFAGLMLLPLAVKVAAWGGLRRAWRWFMQKRLALTRGGFVFLGVTVLFGVAAINTGTNLLYLILAMLLSLIVLSGILSELVVTGLRISRRLPPYVFAGEEFRVGVALANPRRATPSLALEIRESSGLFGGGPGAGADGEGPAAFVFRLDPGERRVVSYAATLPRRGVYPLTGFTIATKFPFGFFVKFKRAELPAEIVVYPAPRELAPETVRALGQAQDAPRPRMFHHSPDEFRATRDYRLGDNPRWIHWRSTARRRRLVVKEFEPRATRTSAVVLDADPGESGREEAAARAALDRGTTLAASLVEHLTRLGERPELVIAGAEVVRFGARSGGGNGAAAPLGAAATRRGSAAYLEALARLAPASDPGYRRVIEAASPAIRRGSRVFVLTARDAGAARRAIEQAEPAAAQAIDVISFATEAAVARLYVTKGAA